MFFVVKIFFLPAYSINHVGRNTVQYLWIAPYALNPTHRGVGIHLPL